MLKYDRNQVGACFLTICIFASLYMKALKISPLWAGVALALLAVIIWSGNYVIARGIKDQISPGSLAFFRWSTATILFLPFAWKPVRANLKEIKQSLGYLTITAFLGVTVFNTLLYVGAHFTSAINLALISTTLTPVFVILLARWILRESLDRPKIIGMILCVMGVLYLLWRASNGNIQFTAGDGWIVLSSLSFAFYNILVKRKPKAISPVAFLWTVFALGAIMLVPYFLYEHYYLPAIKWDQNLMFIILYLGVGTSIISFLCWNKAIQYLGAGRTALFGNLIPVFSIMEAALLLGEQFGWMHAISMIIIFCGILVANWRLFFPARKM